ncbi:GGDEF domain-containing protein [Kineosporia sp. NBRC 101731]|uniref:tetratricopeptide repeat-containing diguanylate cyclase n=1 Tax=Kineosporia sp. NBRC 101731 TaxID=3032199 RepID=UPI0024A220B9|nr:GGDEF domain-containing protein [Kineosporia sp. NBRC 101731]GLY29596.1 hypothetical protein Kisp02_29610 [Kineosporia sp. NBRC 101731]
MGQVQRSRTDHDPATFMIRMRRAQVEDVSSAILAELSDLQRLVTSEPDVAIGRAQDLQQRAEALGLREAVAGALLCQAEGHQRSGELAAAVTLINQACDLWAPLSADNQVRAYLLKSFVYNDLGDEPTALQRTMDANAAFTPEVSVPLRVRVLTKTADLLHDLGDQEDSVRYYGRAEELANGDPKMHLLVANNRAYSALEDGRIEDALAGARQLWSLSERYGHPLGAAGLDTIARIHLLAGDPVLAAVIAQQAVDASGQVDFQTADAGPYYLLTLAVVQRALGDLPAAWTTLARARQACSEEGYDRCKNQILREQADVRAELGDHRAAYEMLRDFVVADADLLSRRREAQARIRQAIFETLTAREEAARYREEARRDPLTGLRNRLYVHERLGELLEEPGLRGELSVALVDLDHFKSVNDEFSHEAGDRVLQTIGLLLEETVPGGDSGSFVARLGGEELLLVLVTADRAQAVRIVEQARLAVQNHDWSGITPGRGITFSAGVTTRVPGDLYNTLLSRADQQLYTAKSQGRNRISSDG